MADLSKTARKRQNSSTLEAPAITYGTYRGSRRIRKLLKRRPEVNSPIPEKEETTDREPTPTIPEVDAHNDTMLQIEAKTEPDADFHKQFEEDTHEKINLKNNLKPNSGEISNVTEDLPADLDENSKYTEELQKDAADSSQYREYLQADVNKNSKYTEFLQADEDEKKYLKDLQHGEEEYSKYAKHQQSDKDEISVYTEYRKSSEDENSKYIENLQSEDEENSKNTKYLQTDEDVNSVCLKNLELDEDENSKYTKQLQSGKDESSKNIKHLRSVENDNAKFEYVKPEEENSKYTGYLQSEEEEENSKYTEYLQSEEEENSKYTEYLQSEEEEENSKYTGYLQSEEEENSKYTEYLQTKEENSKHTEYLQPEDDVNSKLIKYLQTDEDVNSISTKDLELNENESSKYTKHLQSDEHENSGYIENLKPGVEDSKYKEYVQPEKDDKSKYREYLQRDEDEYIKYMLQEEKSKYTEHLKPDEDYTLQYTKDLKADGYENSKYTQYLQSATGEISKITLALLPDADENSNTLLGLQADLNTDSNDIENLQQCAVEKSKITKDPQPDDVSRSEIRVDLTPNVDNNSKIPVVLPTDTGKDLKITVDVPQNVKENSRKQNDLSTIKQLTHGNLDAPLLDKGDCQIISSVNLVNDQLNDDVKGMYKKAQVHPHLIDDSTMNVNASLDDSAKNNDIGSSCTSVITNDNLKLTGTIPQVLDQPLLDIDNGLFTDAYSQQSQENETIKPQSMLSEETNTSLNQSSDGCCNITAPQLDFTANIASVYESSGSINILGKLERASLSSETATVNHTVSGNSNNDNNLDSKCITDYNSVNMSNSIVFHEKCLDELIADIEPESDNHLNNICYLSKSSLNDSYVKEPADVLSFNECHSPSLTTSDFPCNDVSCGGRLPSSDDIDSGVFSSQAYTPDENKTPPSDMYLDNIINQFETKSVQETNMSNFDKSDRRMLGNTVISAPQFENGSKEDNLQEIHVLSKTQTDDFVTLTDNIADPAGHDTTSDGLNGAMVEDSSDPTLKSNSEDVYVAKVLVRSVDVKEVEIAPYSFRSEVITRSKLPTPTFEPEYICLPNLSSQPVENTNASDSQVSGHFQGNDTFSAVVKHFPDYVQPQDNISSKLESDIGTEKTHLGYEIKSNVGDNLNTTFSLDPFVENVLPKINNKSQHVYTENIKNNNLAHCWKPINDNLINISSPTHEDENEIAEGTMLSSVSKMEYRNQDSDNNGTNFPINVDIIPKESDEMKGSPPNSQIHPSTPSKELGLILPAKYYSEPSDLLLIQKANEIISNVLDSAMVKITHQKKEDIQLSNLPTSTFESEYASPPNVSSPPKDITNAIYCKTLEHDHKNENGDRVDKHFPNTETKYIVKNNQTANSLNSVELDHINQVNDNCKQENVQINDISDKYSKAVYNTISNWQSDIETGPRLQEESTYSSSIDTPDEERFTVPPIHSTTPSKNCDFFLPQADCSVSSNMLLLTQNADGKTYPIVQSAMEEGEAKHKMKTDNDQGLMTPNIIEEKVAKPKLNENLSHHTLDSFFPPSKNIQCKYPEGKDAFVSSSEKIVNEVIDSAKQKIYADLLQNNLDKDFKTDDVTKYKIPNNINMNFTNGNSEAGQDTQNSCLLESDTAQNILYCERNSSILLTTEIPENKVNTTQKIAGDKVNIQKEPVSGYVVNRISPNIEQMEQDLQSFNSAGSTSEEANIVENIQTNFSSEANVEALMQEDEDNENLISNEYEFTNMNRIDHMENPLIMSQIDFSDPGKIANYIDDIIEDMDMFLLKRNIDILTPVQFSVHNGQYVETSDDEPADHTDFRDDSDESSGQDSFLSIQAKRVKIYPFSLSPIYEDDSSSEDVLSNSASPRHVDGTDSNNSSSDHTSILSLLQSVSDRLKETSHEECGFPTSENETAFASDQPNKDITGTSENISSEFNTNAEVSTHEPVLNGKEDKAAPESSPSQISSLSSMFITKSLPETRLPTTLGRQSFLLKMSTQPSTFGSKSIVETLTSPTSGNDSSTSQTEESNAPNLQSNTDTTPSAAPVNQLSVIQMAPESTVSIQKSDIEPKPRLTPRSVYYDYFSEVQNYSQPTDTKGSILLEKIDNLKPENAQKSISPKIPINSDSYKHNPRPGKVIISDIIDQENKKELNGDILDATAWIFLNGVNIRVIRGCWILYEKPNFEGQAHVLEEGEAELLHLWEPPQANSKPERITIGSIKRVAKDYIPEVVISSLSDIVVCGSSIHLQTEVPIIENLSNRKPQSLSVISGVWLAYTEPLFSGTVSVLQEGFEIPQIQEHGIKSLRPLKMGGLKVQMPSDPKIILYQKPGFEGWSREITEHIYNMKPLLSEDDNKEIGSIRVIGGIWVGYEKERFKGQQYLLEEGEYENWHAWGGFNSSLESIRYLQADFLEAAVTLFESEVDDRKKLEIFNEGIPDLELAGYGTETQCLHVQSGMWVAYQQKHFCGEQYILEKGRYKSCVDWGGNTNTIMSIRPVLLEPLGKHELKHLIKAYNNMNFQGQCMDFTQQVSEFESCIPSSFKVLRGCWLMCYQADTSDNVCILEEGHYPDLASCGCPAAMIKYIKPIDYVFAEPLVSLFALDSCEGRELCFEEAVSSILSKDLHFYTQSVWVRRGLWIVYEEANFLGRQKLLDPGKILNWAEFSGWKAIGSLRPLKQPAVYFRIKNRHINKYLTVTGSLADSRATFASVSPRNGQTTQIWYFCRGVLKSKANDSCLDIIGGKNTPGSKVSLWTEHGKPRQKWRINTDGTITSYISDDLVLDIKGGNYYDQNHIVVNKVQESEPTQKWDIEIL